MRSRTANSTWYIRGAYGFHKRTNALYIMDALIAEVIGTHHGTLTCRNVSRFVFLGCFQEAAFFFCMPIE
jgi:hypothetical protein